MEKFNTVKKLLLLTSVFASSVSFAQTVKPKAFEMMVGTTLMKNWYKDYVGTRLQVSAPTTIARDLPYTTSNDGGGGTNNWGGFVTTPLVDIPIVMGTGADSFGCTSFVGGFMTGKIAVIWRGGPGGVSCEFGAKALAAEQAGAIACVLINHIAGEGPVGMAAGAQGASVTIPVYMIGNQEGMALAGAYRNLPANTVKMTITPWGRGNTNDLGFVPGGVSVWHNNVIPAYQLIAAATTNPVAYKGINGAFVANYGSANQTNVKLTNTLTYTPTGGAPSVIKNDDVTLASFPALDSIYAMFAPEYNLSGVTGPGKFDLKYEITSAATDENVSDNSYTHTYYASDSVFSKSRYDFANNHPISTLWTGANATSYLWGVPYFVAKGGSAIKDIQFSASQGPGSLPNQEFVLFYVFKWNDGTIAADKIIENGELSLVGTAGYVFGPQDSSFKFYNSSIVGKDTNGGGGFRVILEDNATYLVCIEPNTSANLAIGCDGIMNHYPRAYGRAHFNSNIDLYNPVFAAPKATAITLPADSFLSYAFGGGSYNVDSVVYSTQYGLIPSLAMRVWPYTGVDVKNTVATATKFELYPNPATDHVTVSMELVKQAKNVSYTVINGMAQVVSRVTKTDVLNDTYTYNTSNLPAGNYYMVVAADGKSMFKQFTVLKK